MEIALFDWVTGVVEQTGYVGIALLMLAENLFPPIPSEMIMPLAGFSAAQGKLHVVPVLLAGIVGSLAGAVFWYLVGRWVGAERLKRWTARHGRWLTITPADVDQASAWFEQHGGIAVLIGRLVPAVRTLFSVPAGLAAMPPLKFLTYSALGTGIWTAFLTAAGYLLEDQHQRVAGWLNPVSNVVIGVLVLWYLYRVATFGGRAKA